MADKIAVTEVEPGIFETKRVERERFQFPDTLADLERVLSAHGSHYFDDSTRRFFRSRMGRFGVVRAPAPSHKQLAFLFVESTQGFNLPREYRLCRWTPWEPSNVERLFKGSADQCRRRFDALMRKGEGALLPVEKLGASMH